MKKLNRWQPFFNIRVSSTLRPLEYFYTIYNFHIVIISLTHQYFDKIFETAGNPFKKHSHL